jgi:hypothetical protein
MRTFIITLCLVAVLILGVVVFLVATTPASAPPLRFPVTAAQQDLLRHIPADAEAYALVPAPAVLLAKLKTNPITSEPVTRWTDEHALPPAAMLGRADAVAWRSEGKPTAYAIRFDPVRALIARAWTMFTPVDTSWHGRVVVINADAAAPATSPPPELTLAHGLPDGDVFVVQRKGSRGAYPPVGRPAVSSVRVDGKVIDIVSRAASDGGSSPLTASSVGPLPRGAMLAVSFTHPPRLLGDLQRLVAADLDALLGDGGLMAIYDVDTGTFLPRPFLAVVVPADEAGRVAAKKYETVLSDVREANGQLILAFDRNSGAQYLADTKAPVPWPANQWAVRMDPVRLIPVLRKVGDNPALRFAAPRIHRGARDLRRWMGTFEQAREIEAAASVSGGIEELRVRVASK